MVNKNLICPDCREYPGYIVEDIKPVLTENIPLQIIICKNCFKKYLDIKLNRLTKYRLIWFFSKSEEIQKQRLKDNNLSFDDFQKLQKKGIEEIWKIIIKSKEEI